ncbi:MAG TPA: SDR family NAD(P)-dependent oxidoreductase [Solirubrobacteraceae bacterium]|jgi:citronellol/citronellal dehydrogenase
MSPPGRSSEIFAPELLRGRTALVTGGGTGLGRATALELARCGAAVTVMGRRADVLEQTVEEIRALHGEADWIVGDVRERDDAQRLVSGVLERHGRLDLLVNNAGGQFFSPAELIAAKGWRAVWRLNVDGMLNMAEAAFELAFAPVGGGAPTVVGGAGAGGSTIVNVTLSPHHGMPGMAHSGAARAAVEALTHELASRWADARVVVTAVAAGHFATDALQKYPETLRAGMARSVPLQRLGAVDEHAWLVTLLSSPLGRAFNGSTVTLDGARDNWFGPWPPPGLAGESGEVPVEARKGALGG